jgi:Zn-dependent protease
MQFDNGSLIAGSWNGSPIRIHWSVLLCAFFFGRFQFIPVYWIAFFIVVFVHEAGHAIVINHFRMRVDEIVLHGMGGHCRWSGDPSPKSRSLVAWGGVFAQLVLLLIAYTSFRCMDPPRNTVMQQMFRAFITSNIWMIFFNLLPVEPLDGKEAWKIVNLLRNDWSTYLAKRKLQKQDKRLKRQLKEIMSQKFDVKD